MDDRLSEKLGQRIVDLARIATAMHLDEALRGSEHFQQEAKTGGAGLRGIGGAGSGDERQSVKSEG